MWVVFEFVIHFIDILEDQFDGRSIEQSPLFPFNILPFFDLLAV